MPVVKTTSPVTERGAPTASPSKRTPSSSRTYALMPPLRMAVAAPLASSNPLAISCGLERDAALPVGDGAGGDRGEDPAAQAPAGERAVLGAALVAGLPHLPLGLEVDQDEVRGAADGDLGRRKPHQ